MPIDLDDTGVDLTKYQRKIKLIYTYDKNPYKLQTVFDSLDNRMIGPNVLVKKAVEIPLRVIAELQIAFGYVQDTVEANITSNIEAFFNGGTTTYGKQFARLEIGDSVQHSNIQNIILRTEGVASFDNDTFHVVNTVTGAIDDPSTIKPNEYATLFDVLFEFNTVNLSNFDAVV